MDVFQLRDRVLKGGKVTREEAVELFSYEGPDLVDLFLSPPVMELIVARMTAKERPAGKHHRRSNKLVGDRVPDLKFRWRSEVAAQRQPGHSSRKPRR